MRKLIVAMTCCCLNIAVFAQSKTAAAPKIVFDGETYYLAYSVKDSAGTWLNEYLRSNDNDLNHYKKLIGVRYYEGSKYTPLEIAQITVHNLKRQYPQAEYNLSKNSKTGKAYLSFLIAEGELTELNAFNLGTYNGKTISFQFVRRWHTSKEFREAYETIEKDLERWVDELNSMPMPKPQKIIKE